MFDYKQEQCDRISSLQMKKMMEQLLSLSLLCFWWIGADSHQYSSDGEIEVCLLLWPAVINMGQIKMGHV